MMPSFAEGNFRTDHNVCSKMPLGGGSCSVEANRLVWVVGRLTGFCIISVFKESFFSKQTF